MSLVLAVLFSVLIFITNTLVNAILLLLAVIISISVYFYELNINFVSLSYIVVYVGGILILFLCVVNVLPREHKVSYKGERLLLLIGLLSLYELPKLISNNTINWEISSLSNVNNIAYYLWGEGIIIMMSLAIYLLALLIGVFYVLKAE